MRPGGRKGPYHGEKDGITERDADEFSVRKLAASGLGNLRVYIGEILKTFVLRPIWIFACSKVLYI